MTLEHGGNVVIEFLGPHYLTGPYTFHINSDQNLTITEPNSATGTVDIVTGAVFEEDAPYAEVDVRLATGTTGHVKFYANAQKKP